MSRPPSDWADAIRVRPWTMREKYPWELEKIRDLRHGRLLHTTVIRKKEAHAALLNQELSLVR